MYMRFFLLLLPLITLPLVALGAAGDTGFQPLTNIPALIDSGNAINTPQGLEYFLNNIYRICIGAAAVLAVFQIMRAGIIYMGGDSVTEKKEAKNLIGLSIGGLLLVLSPYIVFSIINPDILDLKIGNIEGLRSSVVGGETREAGKTWESTGADARAKCEEQKGTVTEPTPGTIRCTPAPTGTCPTYPEGLSTVDPAQQSCCAMQTRCELQALPRSQYRCSCGSASAAPFDKDLSTPGTFTYKVAVQTTRFDTGAACVLYKNGSGANLDSCNIALIQAESEAKTEGTTYLTLKNCSDTSEKPVAGTSFSGMPACSP